MHKILVTGGAGFIGSHTCTALLENGYEIVVVDNLSNSSRKALERVRIICGINEDTGASTSPANSRLVFHECDLLDQEALAQIFAQYEIEAVIHFAAFKAVGESVEKPLAYYRNNLQGTINLCEQMAKHGVKKIVFSSSATVYGVPDSVPIAETAPLRCTNPYGWTKFMCEQIPRDFANADIARSVALLRYFNPIGAHPSGLIGEDPRGIPNNLLPYVLRVAAGQYPQVNIYGQDYPTPDGTGIRDYIHVVDLAAGHVSALKYIDRHTGTEAFNLGTGNGYSVLEIIQAMEKACGCPIPYQITERRPGDAAEGYADNTLARLKLGWIAQYGIDEMCRDAWNWQQKNPRGYENASV
ncbi:MAG: UDP-glucose 4-epimerase GalE [Eubacteriales bacterium]|nr:UDP-glucose 4-epimerase GalE [Eubacteriales bacterium]MDD4683530.1 UDP-glucose 4-epimerase GalE [Eubacteriales bacterium]